MSLFKNGSCVFTVHEAENGFIAEISQAGKPILVIGKTLSECCDAAQAAAASVQVRQAKRKPAHEMAVRSIDDLISEMAAEDRPPKQKKVRS